MALKILSSTSVDSNKQTKHVRKIRRQTWFSGIVPVIHDDDDEDDENERSLRR